MHLSTTFLYISSKPTIEPGMLSMMQNLHPNYHDYHLKLVTFGPLPILANLINILCGGHRCQSAGLMLALLH
jgi:hypothetical protein